MAKDTKPAVPATDAAVPEKQVQPEQVVPRRGGTTVDGKPVKTDTETRRDNNA